MTIWGHGERLGISFSSAGVGRAPLPGPVTPEVTGFSRSDKTAWLQETGSKGEHKVDPSKASVVGGLWVQVFYVLIDIVCVIGSSTLAWAFRFSGNESDYARLLSKLGQSPSSYGSFLLLYVALILLFCHWQDLYRTDRTRSTSNESLAVIKAVSLATLLLSAFIYMSGVKIVSRMVVGISLVLNVIAMSAWRYAKRKVVIHRVKQGIGARYAIIIGAGQIGQALARELDENMLLGYQLKGFLDENHTSEPRVLGKLKDLSRVAKAEFLDEVFITIPSEREVVKEIVTEARRHRLTVRVVPELYDGLGWHAPLNHIGGFPTMELHWQPISTFGLFVKRLSDIVFSTIGLVLYAPLLPILALWIKLDSPGPVFYRSPRVGRKGRIFTCYKLRTMVCDADLVKNSLRGRNEREGPIFKIADDPRITGIGRILRKYSLDEFPQLWSALKGDMSLVGPRPHPLDDFENYQLDHLRRLEVRPGITGLWQISARKNPSFDINMKLDLEYIENWSLFLDLRILVNTVPAVLEGTGQ